MKTLIPALLFALFLPLIAAAADAPTAAPAGAAEHSPHRVVFELTSADPGVWNGALNNVENLRQALGAGTQIEVVAHGHGLGFLLRTNTAQADRMQRLADAGVVFAACRNTMRREHVTPEALLPFATTVDSGVAEIVRRQDAGWAYVHVGS
jgi:intracellular sulfur oxidation DsrE/DsrF family protein